MRRGKLTRSTNDQIQSLCVRLEILLSTFVGSDEFTSTKFLCQFFFVFRVRDGGNVCSHGFGEKETKVTLWMRVENLDYQSTIRRMIESQLDDDTHKTTDTDDTDFLSFSSSSVSRQRRKQRSTLSKQSPHQQTEPLSTTTTTLPLTPHNIGAASAGSTPSGIFTTKCPGDRL